MKVIAVVCAALILVLAAQPLLAYNVGITPDSPLYLLKRLLENLDIMLTFNDVSKAEKYLNYAKMRLMEAIVMAEKGKYSYVNELLRDYVTDLHEVAVLVKMTNPSDSEKIASMVVNETAVYLSMLDNLSKIVPENSSVRLAEINTIRQAELAVRNAQSGKVFLELSLTKVMIELAGERIRKGERASFLIEESDKILKDVERRSSGRAPVYIVEEVKRIVDEATNISIVKRNITHSIIERGIEIYRKLGVNPVIR